jgi:hypothetical protein
VAPRPAFPAAGAAVGDGPDSAVGQGVGACDSGQGVGHGASFYGWAVIAEEFDGENPMRRRFGYRVVDDARAAPPVTPAVTTRAEG